MTLVPYPATTAAAAVLPIAVAALVGAPASAAVVSFVGTAAATAAPFADPSCAPLPFRGLATGSGTSSLGQFAYSHNVCIVGAVGPVIGTFVLNFGDAAVSGLLDGVATARVGVPGLFDQQFAYTMTGGTGRFAGATGRFTNIGTVDVRGGPPSRLSLNFEGTLNAPAIPEPATWAMMITGFGLVGAVARRGRDLQLGTAA